MGTSTDNINKLFPNNDIDVVIPIPDTSRISALGIVKLISHLEGFIKNRYIGRTFIMSQQNSDLILAKANAIKSEFNNKNVLLVVTLLLEGQHPADC